MSSALKEFTRSGGVLLGAFLSGASFMVNAAPGAGTTAETVSKLCNHHELAAVQNRVLPTGFLFAFATIQ